MLPQGISSKKKKRLITRNRAETPDSLTVGTLCWNREFLVFSHGDKVVNHCVIRKSDVLDQGP